MRRALGLVLVGLCLGSCLQASEFDWVVRRVERESGCKRTNIPFFGLARFAVAVGHPAGASELNLAIFEHADVTPARFGEIMTEAAGSFWKPIIRVRSNKGESTTILAQRDGNRVRLFIGNFNGSEATLAEVRLDVDQLLRFVDDQRKKEMN